MILRADYIKQILIDTSIHRRDEKIYCNVCKKYISYLDGYTTYLRTAIHNRKLAMMLAPPDEFDPNFNSSVCNKAFGRIKYYRAHLKNVYRMILTRLKRIPDLNIAPNVNNSNNQCDSCNWTYTSKSNYHQHLIEVHKMIIPPILRRTTPNPSVLPDTDDPNNYCKSCQGTYKDRRQYRAHLRGKLKLAIEMLKKQTKFDPAITANDTKNSDNKSCTICKFTYSSKKSYRHHEKVSFGR